MANNDPFGFDPEDLDRIFPGAGEQLRGLLGQFGKMFDGSGGGAGLPAFFAEAARRPASAPERTTTGDTGDGVWAIYSLDGRGGAQVEQVYATELDALRANKHNTDSSRRVRFLPYGIAVSVLDEPTVISDAEISDAELSDAEISDSRDSDSTE